MKILIASDGHGEETHAGAFTKAFRELGHEVITFTWKEYFKHYPYADAYPTDGNRFKSIYYRFQNKFTFGPDVLKLNKDLVKRVAIAKPDLVFIYRGTHILPGTLKRIKKMGIPVFGYNNDDPFSSKYLPYMWRHFKRCIPFYNHIFYYREKNRQDYENMGYKNISMLRSYYIKENNFQIKEVEQNQYTCDAIFIGHFENDGRDEMLRNVIESGVNFKLYGSNWQASSLYPYFVEKFGPIMPLYREDYNLALNSAKIALVFLSKLNNDTYTRRCFEIPATGTMMLAEYTDDLNHNLFTEDKEAVYFRDEQELIEKINLYTASKSKREAIAKAGYDKVHTAGHEVTDRAKQVIDTFNGMHK